MKRTPLQQYKIDLQKALREANVTDWFERYINKSRGMGNTDALLYAARMRSATIITHSHAWAGELNTEHKVKAAAVGDKKFSTMPTKSVVDNGAILMLVQESKRIQMLAEQLLTLMHQKGID